MKKFNIILAFFLLTFNFNAQEYAAVNTRTISNNSFHNDINDESEITPLLYNKRFTYKYQGDEVLVIFTNREHIEYFNNKKYYIKSDITWISKHECLMTLKESNLPRFPFVKGTKLKMKITSIKKNTIYYESTLVGKTWKGKLKRK